jgi:hypothetical protein
MSEVEELASNAIHPAFFAGFAVVNTHRKDNTWNDLHVFVTSHGTPWLEHPEGNCPSLPLMDLGDNDPLHSEYLGKWYESGDILDLEEALQRWIDDDLPNTTQDLAAVRAARS